MSLSTLNLRCRKSLGGMFFAATKTSGSRRILRHPPCVSRSELHGCRTKCESFSDSQARCQARFFSDSAKSQHHAPEVAPPEQYDMLVPDIFRIAAKAYPNQIALDGPSFQMTYAELDAKTDLLAAFLRANYHAVPETVIGVYMERCEEYVIALLAIWKAGAAYCPIELAYPGPLLQSVFEEVKPQVVLTKDRYVKNIPLSTSRFSMDDDWSGVVQRTAPNVDALMQNQANPESLGYVIYSGGSTGRPKGIEAPFRSPVASYLWRYSISGYGPGARVGCNVFFVWEIFRPLMRGGTTVVIPDDIIFDTVRLAPYLESKAITEVLFTPSLFETLLDTIDINLLKKLPLENVWLNGEVVTTKLLQKAATALPHVGLFNTYSISECGEVCAGPLAEREDCPKFSPVGRVAGFAKHVLMDTDSHKPVPQGTPGELWVSGRGVGRGYSNNPQKTAEVFITHDGVPFYRTGDLARELHDGVLEILGRCDFMVKVRGYSVVLGSVEAAIAKLVGVSQCCVVASGEEGTDKRLVAYLVGCTPEANRGRLPIESAEIDAYGRSPVLFQELIKDLPHYAVPSVYMVLDSMPIHKTSAKTDRHALPPPPPSPPAAVIPDGFVFESSDASIQFVFEEVLGLPKDTLTGESNFFEFGGHSLLVTQLLARIKALGGPEVTVADFLQSPTVSGFARAMRGESVQSEPARLLPREVEKYTSGMSDININVQAFWRYVVFTNSSARVLLTGATGYVGVNLLAHLLQNTAAQVFCIVRARSDNEDVHARVVANLEAHGFEGLDVSRIQVIAGDVSQHNMGLSDDDYLFLQQLVDVVIHTAANVNLAYSYSLLEAANVHGTAHMIDFARGGKVKALHFISTDGIFPEMGDIGSFSEEDVPPHHLLQTGYGQTKWVAEQLVAGARRLGMPCVVYRLGNVAGPLAGSGWNGSDSNLLFLRACLDRRSVPRDDHWGIEFTPVDFVAKFITSCIMDLEFANGKTFHLINSSKLPMQLVGEAAKRAGFSTNRVDKSSWCEEGKNAEGLLSVVLGEDALESLMGRHHEYLQDNVNKACKHFGMTYPVIDSAALDGYFARLIGEGLLPSPPTSEKLGGRVALVTGATSSIGQGIAVALAAEGATVVLAARGAEKLHQVSAKLNGAVSMPCDLSSREAVENMISQVEQKHKIIDILVNCAEAVPQQTHVENTDAVLDANCKGVVHMCGATMPMMSQAGSGHIVNISLDSSLKSGCTDPSVHDASKAFVKAFSKGLRSQCAGTGVRITDVQPADAAALKPDDVAAAVLYAVSSPAHVGVHEVFVEARVNSMTQPL